MSWNSFFNETLTIVNATDDRRYSPVEIGNASGSQLAIVASNPNAKPTWFLACKLAIVAVYSEFPIASAQPFQVLRQRIGLSQHTVIDVPAGINHPYQVRLEIPFWHESLNVQLWQRGTVGSDRQLLTASAAGQTEFILSAAPEQPAATELYINGIKATYRIDYRIEGDRLVWLAAMPLDATDEIELIYSS